MTLTLLKIFCSIALLFICYTVITTQQLTPLFDNWDALSKVPWMKATLWDFYANVFVLSLWICYKEKSILAKICWVIGFCLLGSIATLAYVLVQLFTLKKDDDVLNGIFSRK